MEKLKGKRIFWPERGRVEVEDFKIKHPETNEVLIKTQSTLISPGSEAAFLMALPNASRRFPQYPGYSNAGEVIAVGGKTSGIELGDRVASSTPHSSYVLAPKERVFKMPETLSFDEATFFNLAGIALQGVRKAEIELGDSVVVLGQGLVGQLALRIAKLGGAIPLVGIGHHNKRLHVSRKGGADYVLNSKKVDIEKEVIQITQGKGANVVIEATGNPEVIPLSFRLAGKFGRIVLLGSPRGESKVNFYSEVHYKGLLVVGARAPSTRPKYESFHRLWTNQDDVELVLKLLDKELIKVDDLISLKMGFQNASLAYKKIIGSKEDVLGIVLDWT